MLPVTHPEPPPLTIYLCGEHTRRAYGKNEQQLKDRPAPMEQDLDPILSALAHDVAPSVPGGFMEGVWERVGDISARQDRAMRSMLFAGLFAVGLGAGALTVQAPVYAQEPTYPVFSDARLTPAALLHVD